MSEFECPLVKIDDIKSIDGADFIEVAQVSGFQCVVAKNQFKVGDHAIYIPEQSIVPEWILEELNLKGKLVGKNKNRVKAIKLKSVLSQGLLYPIHSISDSEFSFNLDGNIVTYDIDTNHLHEILGIEKYEPVIPSSFSGQVCYHYPSIFKFDIENYKKDLTVIPEGKEVYYTEKLHGSFMRMTMY